MTVRRPHGQYSEIAAAMGRQKRTIGLFMLACERDEGVSERKRGSRRRNIVETT